MMAAATLLFGDGSKVGWVLLIVGFLVKAGLGALFGFAQVDTLLLRVMWFLDLTAIALDVGGSFLSFKTTMLTLGDGSAFFRDQSQLAVSMGAATHAVALET